MTESFRCRCDPAAEYFNVIATGGGRAPFGHPPRITRDERKQQASFFQCKRSLYNRTRGCHRRKGQQEFPKKVIFLFPIPLLLRTRDALQCKIQSSLPDFDFGPWCSPSGSAPGRAQTWGRTPWTSLDMAQCSIS